MKTKNLLYPTLLLALIASANSTYAQEQRCIDLGTHCVCSEPLNTSNYAAVLSSWYNPGDSDPLNGAKECNVEDGIPKGAAVTRNSNDLYGSNMGAEITALPAGHTNMWVLRGSYGHTGMWNVGNGDNQWPGNTKRIAARWYIYHSSDFQFAGQGLCHNSKMASLNSGVLLDKSYGSVHMYNFLTWDPSQDCCLSGPGPSNVDSTDWRGAWWRVEMVVSNPYGQGATIAGTGPVMKLYMKNITTNGPELTIVDTGMPGTQLSPTSDNRTPPNPIDAIVINNHRYGVCDGYIAVSHYMAASWSVDSGQRIGPAFEIEGTGTTSISENVGGLLNVYVYPIPATNNLTLVLPAGTSKTEIIIYNTLGEKVFASTAPARPAGGSEEKTALDISKLVSGVYLLEAKQGNEISRQKFIKQ